MTTEVEIPQIAAVEAERALIGSMLWGAQNALELVPLIGDDDLLMPVHKTVLAAVRTLLAEGEPVDPITVLGVLRRDGQVATLLDQNSAAVALHKMYEAVPVRIAGPSYYRDVLDAALRRRIAEMGGRLLRLADDGNLDSLVRLVGTEAKAVRAIVERRQRLSTPAPRVAEAA
jgi:replicative DNA helicase